MRKLKRVRQAMYVQDLKHLKIKKEDLPEILSKCGAEEWAYIEHNKDETRPHLHVVLKFKNARLVSAIAKIFSDAPQYVDTWKGSINNAYSYLLHRTSDAKTSGKYQYDPSEVVASFDFQKRIKNIETEVKLSPKEVEKAINEYSECLITKAELQQKIGVLNFAKRKTLIDNVTQVLAYQKHQQFLKDFKGKKCKVFWLYGASGVGKTRTAREVFEERHPDNFFVTGSARDHFQNYEGQNYIIINDLRPKDYDYGSLLTMLDPFELDKSAPSRYYDKFLDCIEFIISTSYDPISFFQSAPIDDIRVDKFDQLDRRIEAIEVTNDNVEQVKKKLLKYDDLQQAILKIKKAKHTDQDNA